MLVQRWSTSGSSMPAGISSPSPSSPAPPSPSATSSSSMTWKRTLQKFQGFQQVRILQVHPLERKFFRAGCPTFASPGLPGGSSDSSPSSPSLSVVVSFSSSDDPVFESVAGESDLSPSSAGSTTAKHHGTEWMSQHSDFWKPSHTRRRRKEQVRREAGGEESH